MNTVLTIIGWVGWIVIAVLIIGGCYLLWSIMTEATNPNLPKCDECGWVEGVNDDCDTCHRTRK